jgi:uncharacterized protein
LLIKIKKIVILEIKIFYHNRLTLKFHQISFYKISEFVNKMANKIFVNLPVKDLNKSIAFFTKLGFSFNPQFTDENATCMIISENIYVMLLVEKFFKTFTKKDISDANKTTEVLISIDAESRYKVDEMVKKAVEAGGLIYAEPMDNDMMYAHSFADLDGHQWEILYMDENALKQQQEAEKYQHH